MAPIKAFQIVGSSPRKGKVDLCMTNGPSVLIYLTLLYFILEIKPCGLGSRIRDMEADLIYWCTFLTSMEAVRGQTPYSDRTLWHFNSMFGPSHSAKVCGHCMVFGL